MTDGNGDVTAVFVALEGAKGVGKTSVCELLAEQIDVRHVIVTKEPTGRFDLSNEERLRGIGLAAAIAADRRDHVAEVIEPALRSSTAVVCDRYILSSLVFHTADGVSAAEIWGFNVGFPLPTFNVVLSAPADVLLVRRQSRPATRLQATWSPEIEMSRYRHFADEMARRNQVKTIEAVCTTPDDRRSVIQLILKLVSKGASA